MKMKKLLLRLPLLVLTIAVIAVPMILVNLFFIGGAIGQMMPANGGIVEGTVTTEKVETTQPDLDMEEVSQKITKMRPAATPLATIFSAHAKKVKVRSQETQFYAVDVKPFSDTVKASYDKSSTDGQDYAAIAVNDITLFDIDDTVMFPDIKGGDDKPFVGAISEKNNVNGTISIMPLNGVKGSGTMASKEIVPKIIAADSLIVRMGVAKSELDAQTAPFAIMPEKEYNYTQNFMAQVEESAFQRMTKKEVQWDFTDYEEMNIYDMKARKELSYIWGVRKSFIDKADNQRKFTCGGLTRFMDKEIHYTYADGLSNATWVDWTKKMFEDNAGSDTRFMFSGDDLLSIISKIDGISKQLDGKNVDVKWGINFNVVETKFGILYIKRHPLFRLAGQSKNGIILDVNNIEEHEFVPLEITTLDLKKSGQRNADATVLRNVSCPVLRYPATHAMILGL
jgi:hypothetical protein